MVNSIYAGQTSGMQPIAALCRDLVSLVRLG